MAEIYQVLVKLLDGKTKTLNFPTPTIPITSLKSQIQSISSIPIPNQLLLSNGKLLQNHQTLTIHAQFPSIHLLCRLRGGKGGFGSLLRGAATKAGQKKTNNFDACRDMSGRRLRHVNAEKKMEEWKAEADERRLEKLAEEFIKKQVKEGKKQGKGGESAAQKYVEKYRKDSAKCMEEVDKTVRESLGSFFKNKSKRKVVNGEANGSEVKKLKIWKVKGKLDESDSDNTDEDDSDDEMGEENDNSVVINNGNSSDSHKESDGSSGSVSGKTLEGESSIGCSSRINSEEDKETVENGSLESSEIPNEGTRNQGDALEVHEESMVKSIEDSNLEAAAELKFEAVQAELNILNKPESCNLGEIVACQLPSNSSPGDGAEANGNPDFKPEINGETVAASSSVVDLDNPLNFDEYSSAAEMEALGMERLKSELQERGLKCGGTLQERAARLFLLKTMPLEKIPKKLLAKK